MLTLSMVDYLAPEYCYLMQGPKTIARIVVKLSPDGCCGVSTYTLILTHKHLQNFGSSKKTLTYVDFFCQ